ncbi:16S rRNA (guanine(527)-N(7))-methyltransferase RsmG [Candidatus Bealeia paramacronuclearis]
MDRFQIYKVLLLKWQKAINLVSRETIKDLENRHFKDSLQLLDYISEDLTSHLDLGSGAGFPGLVLAIASSRLQTTLVESDQRKCEFLKNVSRETKTPVTILNVRIENLGNESKYDLITARALAPLIDLLKYSEPLSHDGTQFLFLKGRGFKEEIEDAEKKWKFDLEIFHSSTHSEGVIIQIKNLKKKEG